MREDMFYGAAHARLACVCDPGALRHRLPLWLLAVDARHEPDARQHRLVLRRPVGRVRPHVVGGVRAVEDAFKPGPVIGGRMRRCAIDEIVVGLSKTHKLSIIDCSGCICNQSICSGIEGDRQLFDDDDHLSEYGARKLAVTFVGFSLKRAFVAVLASFRFIIGLIIANNKGPMPALWATKGRQ